MRREVAFDDGFLASLRRIQILARDPSGGRLEGARAGPRHGPGIEFADWRPYLAGDSPRDVDWRAFARLGRLFVRLRAREEASNVYLLTDASGSMAFGRPGKFTFARRVAGALAATALSGLDAVTPGLIREGACELGERMSGADRLPDVLRFLESASASGGTDVPASLDAFLDRVAGCSPLSGAGSGGKGVLVALSDFWCERPLGPVLLRAAELGMEGSLVQVLAPSEIEPRGGRLRLTDSETGEELAVEVGRPAREAYREERERFSGEIASAAARAGFRFALLGTDRDLASAILVDLRAAGVVG